MKSWKGLLCWFVFCLRFAPHGSFSVLVRSLPSPVQADRASTPRALDLDKLTVGFLAGMLSKKTGKPRDEECVLLAQRRETESPASELGLRNTDDEAVVFLSDDEPEYADITRAQPSPPEGEKTPRFMRGMRVVGKKNKDKFDALPRSSTGKVLCRWCSEEVSPPRRTFCSSECVHEYRLRTDQNYIRSQCLERDNGICAICGRNAHALYVAAASFSCDADMELSAQARAKSLKACLARRRKHADKKMLVTILNVSKTAHSDAEREADYDEGQKSQEKRGKERKRKGKSKSLSSRSVAELREECAKLALREWSPVMRSTPHFTMNTTTTTTSISDNTDAGVMQTAAVAHLEAPSTEDCFEHAAEEALEHDAGELRGDERKANIPLGQSVWELLDRHSFSAAINALKQARSVSAGHFWQADHIVPVAEGGGLCCLENFRTLCTPCHAQCTRQLRARLKSAHATPRKGNTTRRARAEAQPA